MWLEPREEERRGRKRVRADCMGLAVLVRTWSSPREVGAGGAMWSNLQQHEMEQKQRLRQ